MQFEVFSGLLAQVTPGQIGNGVLVLGAILGVPLVVLKVWKEIRALRGGTPEVSLSPSPLPVEMTKQFATKEELEQAMELLRQEIRVLRERQDEERRTSRTALGNVHRRIDTLVENTSEIKGQLSQMISNMDKLLERELER